MKRAKQLLSTTFVRYMLVGLVSLGVDYSVLVVAYRVFAVELAVAATLGFVVGLLVNFLLNKFWSFDDPNRTVKRTMTQGVLYGMLVTFNLLFTNAFVIYAQNSGLAPEISKLIATGLIALWNFIIYKKIIFRPRKSAYTSSIPAELK